MPIYRYRCMQCGARKEHLQKVSDPPVETCDTCGGALTKQMTAAAFHLKGGGWYKDLYSSSKAGDSAEASASPKPDSGGASTSTGDSASSSSGSGNSSDTSSSSGSSSASSSSTPSSTSTSSAA